MNTTPIIYTPGTVTGGGEVLQIKGGVKATFCFTLNYKNFGFDPADELVYIDHKTGLRMTATNFDLLVIDNNHAWFTGTGMVQDRHMVKFTVEIFVAPDMFYIYIPELDDYKAGGELAGGSVTIYN